MDFIKSFLSDFDVPSLLPKLDTLLSKVELLARIVVMAGPVILLALGLWYLLMPPKEANHAIGYRFFWGMSSVESWKFTQKVAGIAWSGLGLVLSIVMYVISGSFRDKEMMQVIWDSLECLFWEMGLIAVSCLVIDLTVVFTFNSKGDRRREKKTPKGKTEAEVVEEEITTLVHTVNEKIHQKPDLEKAKALGAKLLPKKPSMPQLLPTREPAAPDSPPEETPAEEITEQISQETVEIPTQAPAAPAREMPAEIPEEIPEVAPEVVVEEEPAPEVSAPETPAEPPAPAEAHVVTPAQNLPPVVPPSQQHKNPYGTKKRYPKGTKKKGKK